MKKSWGLCLLVILYSLARPAAATVYPIILKGTVTMEDGSPPPVIVQIERICSDSSGSAPGPITNKKGEYTWRMDIDPLATRECFIRASHKGYTSTTIEVQGLDTTKTTANLPPIVISASVAEPSAIVVSENNIPARAKGPFDAAMKALDATNFEEAASQLEKAVMGSPKFAQGWHALGVVDERLKKPAQARMAYEHAIDADPKLFTAYVMLAHLCVKTKDWQCADQTADSLLKADAKRTYPEIYLHQAVARYELKNIAGAEAAAQDAIRYDPRHKRPRAEYVLGRILEAKGDLAGAREHFGKYLALEPTPIDVDLVKGHVQNLGKPEAAGVEPELEPL
jgi:Tfp pilus assembly protein PilF